MSRFLRLVYLQCLLYRSRRGYRSSELARLCGVDQRTINRDLEALCAEPFCLPLVMEGWRWRLMPHAGLTLAPIQLSLQEVVTLYLAARRLLKCSDEPNPFVNRALLALADALPLEVGQQVRSMILPRLEDADSAYARVFSTVALAWATGRKVRIEYRAPGDDPAQRYVLSPYLIEPSGTDGGTCVAGHAEGLGPCTLRLEAILQAELLDEVFELPEEVPGADQDAG